jgi:lysozyme
MPLLDCVIDLSHHNQVTSFDAVRQAGIAGVIHKASQGDSFVDNQYHERRAAALAAGLLWGAYHFGEAGPVLPQVRHFLDTVQPTPTDLLVLDFEPCEATMARQSAELFVDEVYIHTGRWCGLYSGMAFCQDTLGTSTETPLARCWLWLARYSTQPPEVPPAWSAFSLWQYTDQGSVPGVEGNCDKNKFNGTLEQLYQLWGVPAPNSQVSTERKT